MPITSEPSSHADPGGTCKQHAPDWSTWQKRPTISVRDGVRLAHDIRPNAGVWKKLKEVADPRVSLVGSDCRTASLSMDTDSRLKPINEDLAQRQSDRLRQKVDIRRFAAWAVETIDNPHMTPEFLALAAPIGVPSAPNGNHVDPWDRSIEILRMKYPLETPGAVTKRLQSVARLLVSIAVDKYRLDVSEAGEQSHGTVAAFERITGDAGFGQMDGETISAALSLAVDLAGREKVLKAIAKRATVPRKR